MSHMSCYTVYVLRPEIWTRVQAGRVAAGNLLSCDELRGAQERQEDVLTCASICGPQSLHHPQVKSVKSLNRHAEAAQNRICQNAVALLTPHQRPVCMQQLFWGFTDTCLPVPGRWSSEK
jgi:hypothetical protein